MLLTQTLPSLNGIRARGVFWSLVVVHILLPTAFVHILGKKCFVRCSFRRCQEFDRYSPQDSTAHALLADEKVRQTLLAGGTNDKKNIRKNIPGYIFRAAWADGALARNCCLSCRLKSLEVKVTAFLFKSPRVHEDMYTPKAFETLGITR